MSDYEIYAEKNDGTWEKAVYAGEITITEAPVTPEALITSRQQAKHYRHNDLTLIEILSERGERISPDDVDSDV